MRPDGPDVVSEGVVAGLLRPERSHTPAGEELLTEQPIRDRRRFRLPQDPRPEEVADVGAQAVDLSLFAVERERVVTALGHPEIAAEGDAERLGPLLELAR